MFRVLLWPMLFKFSKTNSWSVKELMSFMAERAAEGIQDSLYARM
jgi:hypothetical protein